MAKTLLYRFFGVGKLPKQLAPVISKQKILHKDEGVNVFVHYHEFQSAGKKFNNKIVRAVGSICLTDKGIFAGIFGNVAIQLTWRDPRLKAISFSVKKNKFCMNFNADAFDPGASGKVEYQFNCKDPESVLYEINKR